MINIDTIKNLKIKNVILIEGLPGIGNVGKIAVDFLIDSIKAIKFAEIYSDKFPHSVFVNENNLVDLPILSLYHKKIGKGDFVFLVGDVQPVDEQACWEFCGALLDYLDQYKVKEIVTLGGIGLGKVPAKPKVFVTGNNPEFIKSFKGVKNQIYGVVGPIIGVTGLLLGISQRRDIPAAALLAETFAHPAYLGIKGTKEMLGVLEKRYRFKIKIDRLTEEIEEIEKEIRMRSKALEEAKAIDKTKELTYFG